jgi:hypothetical protein
MLLVIDSALKLTTDQLYGNELIAEVLQINLTKIKRNSLFKGFRTAVKDYRVRKVKTGTVRDLVNSIK